MSHRHKPSVDSATFAIPDNSIDEDTEDIASDSSYAGSGDSSSEREGSPVGLLEDALAGALDPSRLDRAIALQAQTSGIINARVKELETLSERATSRLEEIRAIFPQGIKTARQVQQDLAEIQRRIIVLKKRYKDMHPVEYAQAEEDVK